MEPKKILSYTDLVYDDDLQNHLHQIMILAMDFEEEQSSSSQYDPDEESSSSQYDPDETTRII